MTWEQWLAFDHPEGALQLGDHRIAVRPDQLLE